EVALALAEISSQALSRFLRELFNFARFEVLEKRSKALGRGAAGRAGPHERIRGDAACDGAGIGDVEDVAHRRDHPVEICVSRGSRIECQAEKKKNVKCDFHLHKHLPLRPPVAFSHWWILTV